MHMPAAATWIFCQMRHGGMTAFAVNRQNKNISTSHRRAAMGNRTANL
jgi:hypothetical protein